MGYLPVPVAAVAAFLIGGFWYSPLMFGEIYSSLIARSGMLVPAMGFETVILEFGRCLLMSFALSLVIDRLDIRSTDRALAIGFMAWTGLVLPAQSGAVLHEGYPAELLAIHSGDALVKLVVIALVLAWWRRRLMARPASEHQ